MTATDITQKTQPSWVPRPTATCGGISPATATASRRRSSPAAKASTSGTATARNTSTACPGCSSSRSATAATSSPRRPPSRPRRWRSSRCGPTPLRRRSSSPSGSPVTHRATSTGCSSPPAAARPSSRAWKLAKQYFKLTGKPGKYKVISRSIAYHGTPQGALAITGIPAFKAPFEPLDPGRFPRAQHQLLPGTRAVQHDAKAFGRYCADRIAEAIEFEGPDTVAAVFLEPVQNAGGCFPPPPGYFERVREICDEYDVLLVSDEVICAYGRIGSMFACDDFGYVPDIITCAKGLTSGYSPIGAMIASDRLFEPFNDGKTTFAHGYTFGGHPVSSAVALANLDIFEREGHQRPRQGDGPGVPRRRWSSSTTFRSSATSAAKGSSTASNSSRTRPPRRPSTTRRASGCCAGS